MIERLGDVVPLLALILTTIGAIYGYRAAERQKAREFQQAAKEAPRALAGVIAEREVATDYANAMKCLAEAVEKLCEAVSRRERQEARMIEAVDEITKMRRALDDIASQWSQFRRDRMRQDSSD